MTPIEKAIRDFCGYHADWWPSTTQVQEMLALAQPETPEVTTHMIDCPRCGHCCPQPNQEPDFWALFDENQRLRAEMKFNTTPPQQWVGLTDEEIKEIIGPWGDTPIKGYTRKLFDQIEAKLKEKNT
jgi:hypothetical protein